MPNCVSALFCGVLLATCGSPVAAAPPPIIQITSVPFTSGGARVVMDRYAATPAINSPTILVLHGAGGMLFDGAEMKRVARSLAEAGNTVYLLRYFNRTGSLFAVDSTMQRHFNVWLETVQDAIGAAQQDRGTSTPVGLFGYSLGAFLSLAAASGNPRVGAVVELAGGIWNNQRSRIGAMPPVLILHGRDDARVPFAKYAEPLMATLKQRHTQVQTRFFEGEGHVFKAPALVVVRTEAARFFRQHLRPAQSATGSGR